jgi:TonB-dependent receptor
MRTLNVRWLIGRFVTFASALFILTSLASAAGAQGTGRVVGRVVDATTGAPLAEVAVHVAGTTRGAMSGVDGQFRLEAVPVGTITLSVRRLGYQPKTITGLAVPAGRTVEQNVALAQASVQLGAVTVTAAAERGTVSEALDRQRTATGVVNAVTSEQIQRSPDADAAQAVQRVSGVTVTDGRYVAVRGLGERYTTTSLNGARLPSPEPERKVVPLDLFPSGLLQTITTSKTFTPDQPGDFSGASVDIRTREFPAERQFTYSTSLGYNAAGGALPGPRGVGGEAFAWAGARRALPAVARQAGNLTTVTREQKNQIIGAFRDVWAPGSGGTRPNMSLSASMGGDDPLLFGHRVGYLLSGTYSASQEIRSDASRALARAGGSAGAVEEYNRFSGAMGRSSVLLGGLANFSTLVRGSSRLSFNNTFNRTADNDARIERGTFEEIGAPVAIEVLDYVQRALWSSQLAGEHTLGRQQLAWSGTASRVARDQPDRSEFAYERAGPDGSQHLWLNSQGEGAVRTFAALDERAYEGKADYTLELGSSTRAQRIKVGGLARSVVRTADTRAYGISAPILSTADRALPPEELFGGRFTAPGSAVLDVRSLAQGGSYSARDYLYAGYAMLDAALTPTLRLVTGARLESSDIRVDATSTLGEPAVSRPKFTDVLPSLALNYRPSEAHNVRLSLTRTLARPEYREIAAITSRDVLGGVDVRGNPELVRTLIDNADLRWEWYPSADEVVSVGLFAKRFTDPIERVFRARSSGSFTTFVNARSADDYGVEIELRKGLGVLAEPLRPVTVFTNVTLMESRIHLGDAEGSLTSVDRRMVGQSPYVVNLGTTWTGPRNGASATLLYNRVGDRIVNAGEKPLPDVVERPRDVLDFSLRVPVGRGFAARLDAKNLLDAAYEVRQGDVVRELYRAGTTVQAGLQWRP